MAAREENILNVPISETLEGMHVLCDTGDTGEPYRVAASLFIAEATQAAKDAVSNLDPKDVILKGFTALTAGKPAITANTTLLAAIQSLYAMVGSGKVKIVSDGADQTGMVCWNGTSASGFVINVNEAAIYTRSQWTQASPDSVTDANWIAAVKTGGTKTPFAAAAQNPNMGDLPTNSRLKFVDNKTKILGMLKMLTAAANVGRLRIVSGNPATGASGKPELAFIVNIVQGANAETQGTNGLQIFHLTNDYIRVIPSSSVAMAWPRLQTLTDEAIITKLHSTASGNWGGLGVKLPWTGGSVKPIKVEDFAMINEIWPAGLTPGTTVLFYAEGEMYSAPSGATDTAYVGQVTLNADLATSGMATVVAYGNKTGRMYCGKLDFNGQSIDWYPSPVGTLTLTTFANLTANASVGGMKIGEMLGFYSSNGGSTTGPGSSPLFGYIQKTTSSQVNIFAYTIDGKKSWLGYNAGANVIWTPVGGADSGNVLHGENITEGLEYLVPENVGDVVAFRSTMDSAQVPAEQEGFGFLAKVNGSESMAMMMQNDPAGGGKMKFFMGRVQNDGTGTDWQELTTGSSSGGLELVNTTYPITVGDGSEIALPGVTTGDHLMGSSNGTEQLFVGDIALANAAPETFNLGGEVHDGDLLMIVYDFISSDHTMVGPKGGRSIIWTATSGTNDVTVEAFDYSSATGGVSRISGFNLMLSASGTILSMEATGDVDTIIEAFHVVGIYRLSKSL